ncbi:MAG: hypothetical protein ACE5E5_07785 [Phycisphaerae bacterium]
MKKNLVLLIGPVAMALLSQVGCGGGTGNAASFFNPAFVNTLSGNAFPLTPGPGAAFVLVLCVNETNQNAEFLVTIEREVLQTDNDGIFLFEPDGTPVTRTELQRKRLQTLANAPANELGVLFDCSVSPVKRVGLGEDLLRTDAAVFVAGGGAAGVPGFGIPAGDLNPLSLEAGNFNCGDTIVFQAFENRGVAGGVSIQSFVLSGLGRPESFSGPNTFVNFATILESEQRQSTDGAEGP